MPESKTFQRVQLQSENTFGLDIYASKLALVKSREDLLYFREQLGNQCPLILGGGSNILFTKEVEAALLKIETKGIEWKEVNETQVLVTAEAGENWHEFTQFCVSHQWGGIENLSLIPGQVGTTPIQNIGAYGVEIKDSLFSLIAFHWSSKTFVELKAEECKFGYRTSLFKEEAKNQYIIVSVTFLLDKKAAIKTSYGAIQSELEAMQRAEHPSYSDVAQAVMNIRRSKLPDPKQIGNAGSFFKNPEISTEMAERIQQKYPDAPLYPTSAGKKKLAAGWLIEKAGWKGFRKENYGVHAKQALVLVNYGGAKGEDIYTLALDIQADIHSKFGIELEMEVNIW